MDLGRIAIVDAHMHQWDPLTTPRGFSRLARLSRFVPFSDQWVGKIAPRRERQFVAAPHAYLRAYLPADYRADCAGLPVVSVIHIESQWTGEGADETRWVASLPFGVDTPTLGALIAKADPAAPDFRNNLQAHRSASGLLRGIRTPLAFHPDPGIRSVAAPQRALRPEFLRGFAALAEYGVLYETWVYSHQLPDITALAREYPNVPIVLDHLATPAGILGPVGKYTGRSATRRRDIFARWRDNLAELAEQPNVMAKLSGLGLPILGHAVPWQGTTTPVLQLQERLGPLVRHAAAAFGTSRLLWGSNFPIDKPITTIGDIAQVTAGLLADYTRDPRALQRVFRDNATMIYRIPAPQ